MNARHLCFLVVLLALLMTLGCGGESAPKSSIISGRVTFADGLPARGATVTSRDASTVTSTNGAYVLNEVRAADQAVYAEYREGDTRYVAVNIARTFANEQDQNINLVLVPERQTASIVGTVYDRFGNALELVTVFALGSGSLSSNKAITDKDGKFRIDRLMAGESYTVMASAGGYSSDSDQFVLDAGERLEVDFTLGNPGTPGLIPPQDLSIIAWTSFASRDSRQKGALAWAKSALGRPGQASTRLSSAGNPIEVEIEWTPFDSRNILGYVVYRGRSEDSLTGYDFFREPIGSVYIDSDVRLNPNSTYFYQLATASTRYPRETGSLSDRSDLLSVTPLNDLTLRSTLQEPLAFRWNAVFGAEEYVVFLFDEYPGDGVERIWTNSDRRTRSTELVYNGDVPLVRGRTYYFLVLGLADGDNSRTLSEVGSFVFQD